MCVVCLVKTREMNQWRGKETTGAARKEGMAAEMILVVAGSLAVSGDGGREASGLGTGLGPAATTPSGKVPARALLTILNSKGRSH